MRERCRELREALPGVRLVLAAMGPKMCALAGAAYDGAFFNWMTPEFAAGARDAGRGRRRRGRPRDAAGLRLRPHRRRRGRRRRLAKEESFYRDLHNGYRNHFDRLGEPEGTVGVAAADDPAAAQIPLAAYDRPRHRRRPRPRQRQGRADDRRRRGRRSLVHPSQK